MNNPEELPSGWTQAQLGDLADISAGGSAPQDEKYFGGSHPFVRVSHLEIGTDSIPSWDLITDDAVAVHRLRLYPAGTIVFPKSGASIRLEKRAMLPLPMYVVNHLCAINAASDAVDQSFLFFALKRIRFSKEKADSYPTLNLTEIKNTQIVLPPLHEQKAIAQVLRTIQKAKEATEKVIVAAKELKKSMMRHLFTYGPVRFDEADKVELKETVIGTVPSEWNVLPIGEIVVETQYGMSKRGEANGLYPILRMTNLHDGAVRMSDLQYVNLNAEEFRKYKVERGDLLFNRTNSIDLVGKTGLFDDDSSAVFASYLVKLKCKTSEMLPSFLNCYMNQDSTQATLKTLATRAVGQSNINASKLRGFSCPVPSLQVQTQIADALGVVQVKIEMEKKRQEALRVVFDAALSNLMTGIIRLAIAGETS